MEEFKELKKINAELLEALILVLPMAKGYAHEHNVGSNWKIVAKVCDIVESIQYKYS